MASNRDFVEFVVDQLAADLGVTYRMMFGEYALYSGGKIFALICDDRLFMKPTDEGRGYIGRPVEAPAYPGAKPSFLIEDRLEDTDWLSELARVTVRALPEPKPKKRSPKARAAETPVKKPEGAASKKAAKKKAKVKTPPHGSRR